MPELGSRFVVLLVGVLTGALLVFVPSVWAAPGWLAPVDIAPPSPIAEEPQIAMDDAGNAIAIWNRYNGTNEVVEAARRPAGGEWQPPVELSDDQVGDADSPQIDFDAAGNAVAVWRGDNGSAYTIHAAEYRPGSGWGPAFELSDEAAERPQVAVDPKGNAVAVWQSQGPPDIIQASYKQAGGAWGSPVDLSTAGTDAKDPRVVIDVAGVATVIWERADGFDDRIETRRYVSGGWGITVRISDDGHKPQLAVDPDGNLIAVWEQYDPIPGDARIHAATRQLTGGWLSDGYISEAGAEDRMPQVAFGPDGDAIAIWQRAESYYGIQTRVKSKVAGWQPPVTFSPPVDGNSMDPQIAIDALGNVTALWEFEEDAGGVNSLIQAVRKPASGDWLPPKFLSLPGEDATAPQVAVDATGNAVAVWERDQGSDKVIQAAAFDGVGPELRSLSIPAGGQAGEPLTFSVMPFDVISPLGTTSWSFGDGAGATGDSVTHSFTTPGDYVVSVTSTDTLGNETATSGTVRIVAKAAGPGAKGPRRAKARAARLAPVKRGAAALRMRCPKAGVCRGSVKLSVVVKRKRKAKRVLIGKRRVAMAAGKRRNVRVKLNRRGKQRLRQAAKRSGRLKVRLSGAAVKHRNVVLVAPRRR